MHHHPAWSLVILGLALSALGLAWLFLPQVPWLGRLPGDIRVEGPRGGFYFPLTTCILLSLVLTLGLWLVQRLLR